MENRLIELPESSVVEDDVIKRIRTTGVKGLSFENAKELGFFTRISNLLCACHATIMASYRIYCGVSSLLSDFNARRNDIAREMNAFEKSFCRFTEFWTGYYAHGDAGREISEDTEVLFRRIMQWAQLPIEWELGEKQRTDDNGITKAITVDTNDKSYFFHTTTVASETVGEQKESWCVTKYDVYEKKQETVEENMDKASAMMVAKRLSAEDAENIYTASIIREYTEKRLDVIPFKAYMANNTVGKLTKEKK